ncbi:hypothetical protein EKK58_10730 [Candidatus Dependentiae bacterium]|nr:MAG: hypothetical protein EKK58_10730 [Candidatus Dependentiae bacterium]
MYLLIKVTLFFILFVSLKDSFIKNIYKKISAKAFIKKYPNMFVWKQMPIKIFRYKIKNNKPNKQPRAICYWEQLPTDVLEQICLFVLTDQKGDYLPIDKDTLETKKQDYQNLFLLSKQSQKALILAIHKAKLFPDIYKSIGLSNFDIIFFNKHFPIFMLHYLPENIAKCLKMRYLPADTAYLRKDIESSQNVLFIQAVEILKKNILPICKAFIDGSIQLTSYSRIHIPINNFSLQKDLKKRHDVAVDSTIGDKNAMYEVCVTSILYVLKTTFVKYPFSTQHMLIQHLIALHQEYSIDQKYIDITDALKTGVFYISCMQTIEGAQHLESLIKNYKGNPADEVLTKWDEAQIQHIQQKYFFTIDNFKPCTIQLYKYHGLIDKAIQIHSPKNTICSSL